MTAAGKPTLGMILKGYPRISETFISNEILLLEKLGFRIHILSMRQPRESFSHESVKQISADVDYLPETLLIPLPRFLFHNFLLALRIPRRYFQAFKVALRRFARTRKSATFKHLFQAGYLVRKFLPGKGIVHLHAQFAHSPTSVAMFASQLSGLEFSFTAHAKDIYTSDRRQLAEKLAKARFVVTCTEYNRRHLEILADGDADSIHRVYHGIDVDLFSALPIKNRQADTYRLLTVARMTAKKGLPTVYKAIRRLRDQGVAIQHTLIGDGEDRKQILDLIRDLDLEQDVEWLGTLPHHTVLEHYRQADLFVLGCRVAANGDRDGIPNVLLESMAMNVPVVATNVSAISELVEDEKTGLLIPPDDPDKMAAAIMRLLRDDRLRQGMVENGRERVARQFNNRILINDLAEIYRRNIPRLKPRC
jgi:glycosyltransferase involved in cell wall biosynthesis